MTRAYFYRYLLEIKTADTDITALYIGTIPSQNHSFIQRNSTQWN